MSPIHQQPLVGHQQWRALYRQALAAGCARVIGPEDERLASPDELLALALPGLVRLGVFALLADGTSEPPPACARALNSEAAGVLRLLDRALAAHGRDHGYAVTAWIEHGLGAAHATADAASRAEVDAMPQSDIVADAVDAVAALVPALHRDRLGVPGELADALGSVLALYAASAEEVG